MKTYSFSIDKTKDILIEAAPSGPKNDTDTSGATAYQISEAVPGLKKGALNRYLVNLFNKGFLKEKDDLLVTTERGLQFLEACNDIQESLKNKSL